MQRPANEPLFDSCVLNQTKELKHAAYPLLRTNIGHHRFKWTKHLRYKNIRCVYGVFLATCIPIRVKEKRHLKFQQPVKDWQPFWGVLWLCESWDSLQAMMKQNNINQGQQLWRWNNITTAQIFRTILQFCSFLDVIIFPNQKIGTKTFAPSQSRPVF